MNSRDQSYRRRLRERERGQKPMRCETCNEPMIQLLTSWVCDGCDPAADWTDTVTADSLDWVDAVQRHPGETDAEFRVRLQDALTVAKVPIIPFAGSRFYNTNYPLSKRLQDALEACAGIKCRVIADFPSETDAVNVAVMIDTDATDVNIRSFVAGFLAAEGDELGKFTCCSFPVF